MFTIVLVIDDLNQYRKFSLYIFAKWPLFAIQQMMSYFLRVCSPISALFCRTKLALESQNLFLEMRAKFKICHLKFSTYYLVKVASILSNDSILSILLFHHKNGTPSDILSLTYWVWKTGKFCPSKVVTPYASKIS